MAAEFRSDTSHNISYPRSPDTRGSARIYHHRKPYYLGSHDSPLSYIMFGLWKHHLVEYGKALPAPAIREQAEAFLGIVPSSKRRLMSVGLMAFSLTLTWLVGAWFGATFRSTSSVGHVDGMAISTSEAEFIRGVRKHSERFSSKDSNHVARTSIDAIALSKGQVEKDEIFQRIRGR